MKLFDEKICNICSLNKFNEIEVKYLIFDYINLINKEYILKFNLSIFDNFSEDDFDIISKKYPFYNNFTYDEFITYLDFLKLIYDLFKYYSKFKEPKYNEQISNLFWKINKILISDNHYQKIINEEKELTLFGLVFMLTISLSVEKCSYLIDEIFDTEYFRKNITDVKILNKKNFIKNILFSYTIGKVQGPNYCSNPKQYCTSYTFFSVVLRKGLSRIFYIIENIIHYNSGYSYSEDNYFLQDSYYSLYPKECDDMMFLLECLRKHYEIGQQIVYKNKIVEYNVGFINEILLEFKRIADADDRQGSFHLQYALNDYASSIISFKYRRLFEQSLKLVVNKLYIKSKVLSRVKDLNNKMKTLDNNPLFTIEEENDIYKLSGHSIARFEFQRHQFTDRKAREVFVSNINIMYFASDDGLYIDDINCGNELYLAELPNIKNQSNLRINGKLLKEFEETSIIQLTDKVSIHEMR